MGGEGVLLHLNLTELGVDVMKCLGGRVQFGVVAVQRGGCRPVRFETTSNGFAGNGQFCVATLAISMSGGDCGFGFFKRSASGADTRGAHAPQSAADTIAALCDDDPTGFERTIEGSAPVTIDRIDVGEQAAEYPSGIVTLRRDSVDDRFGCGGNARNG